MLNWSLLKAKDTEHRPALSSCAGILYQLSCSLILSNNALLPILLSHALLLCKTFSSPPKHLHTLGESKGFFGGWV